MDWINALRRISFILGLISIALALSGGIHIQHLIDDEGGRHVGETIVFVMLAVLVFTFSWIGARQINEP